MIDLTNPIYHDEDKAREHLEALRWPDGPWCPRCGDPNVARLGGKSYTAGAFHCRACRRKFTVAVGTLFERSHIPLRKWVLALHLMSASKKGMSAHQLHRMLGVTYKTAWFIGHRIREAMREPTTAEGGSALGGANRVVEADETFVGGRAKDAKRGQPVPKKEIVMALVERDGKLRSFHVADVTAKTLRKVLTERIDRASYLMTDEAPAYTEVGTEFGGHGTVNHSIEEYVRGGFWHTNTVEGYFALLKRGIIGTYHHVSAKHLKRYVGEFDFRYNTRMALGVDDFERADKALRGIEGRRPTYRRTGERPGAQA